MSSNVYVVAVDSRDSSTPSDYCCYDEQTCNSDFFRTNIIENPKMKCCRSKVADMCGLDLKIYFMKSKKGLAQHYRQGGEARCMQVLPTYVGVPNNGIASWLTIDPDNGLPEWTITGKAYVVLNDGTAPLSKGQVWGIQEMVHCAMDIYDFDPSNMIEGRDTTRQWASEYRAKTWEPRSGLGGVDIYSYRSGVPISSDGAGATGGHSSASAPPSEPSDGPSAGGIDPLQHQSMMRTVMGLSVQKFFQALEQDMYPDEATEKIFGIDMDDRRMPNDPNADPAIPKGKLIYNVWTEIRKFRLETALENVDSNDDEQVRRAVATADQVFQAELVNAIMDEKLGLKFEEWTRMLVQSSFPLQAYSTEMIRRGFDGPLVNSDNAEHRQWYDQIHKVNTAALAASNT